MRNAWPGITVSQGPWTTLLTWTSISTTVPPTWSVLASAPWVATARRVWTSPYRVPIIPSGTPQELPW